MTNEAAGPNTGLLLPVLDLFELPEVALHRRLVLRRDGREDFVELLRAVRGLFADPDLGELADLLLVDTGGRGEFLRVRRLGFEFPRDGHEFEELLAVAVGVGPEAPLRLLQNAGV